MLHDTRVHEPLARFRTVHHGDLSSARRSAARCTSVPSVSRRSASWGEPRALAWGTRATRETLEATSPRAARCLRTVVYALHSETLPDQKVPLTRGRWPATGCRGTNAGLATVARTSGCRERASRARSGMGWAGETGEEPIRSCGSLAFAAALHGLRCLRSRGTHRDLRGTFESTVHFVERRNALHPHDLGVVFPNASFAFWVHAIAPFAGLLLRGAHEGVRLGSGITTGVARKPILRSIRLVSLTSFR